jgi:hypothetical protein
MVSIFGPEISSLPDGYDTLRESGPAPYEHNQGKPANREREDPRSRRTSAYPNELATRPHSEQIATRDPQGTLTRSRPLRPCRPSQVSLVVPSGVMPTAPSAMRLSGLRFRPCVLLQDRWHSFKSRECRKRSDPMRLRAIAIALAVAAPLLAVESRPAAAFGWCGWGWGSAVTGTPHLAPMGITATHLVATATLRLAGTGMLRSAVHPRAWPTRRMPFCLS